MTKLNIMKITLNRDITVSTIDKWIQDIENLSSDTFIELPFQRFENENEFIFTYDENIANRLKVFFNTMENSKYVTGIGIINGQAFPWTRTFVDLALQDLSPTLLKKLVEGRDDFLLKNCYINSVCNSSEAIYNRLCSERPFQEILSSIKPDTQMLGRSCVAHALMRFFHEKSSSNYSLLTEMKIYQPRIPHLIL